MASYLRFNLNDVLVRVLNFEDCRGRVVRLQYEVVTADCDGLAVHAQFYSLTVGIEALSALVLWCVLVGHCRLAAVVLKD